MGQSSLKWDRTVPWDRAMSYVTEQSHMGQNNLIWDREVSYDKTEHSHMAQSIIMSHMVQSSQSHMEACSTLDIFLGTPGTQRVFEKYLEA